MITLCVNQNRQINYSLPLFRISDAKMRCGGSDSRFLIVYERM